MDFISLHAGGNTLERAKTRRLSARKRNELKELGVDHDEKDETDDSLLDNSDEEEKNIWLRQDTAAMKTKKVLKQKQMERAKLDGMMLNNDQLQVKGPTEKEKSEEISLKPVIQMVGSAVESKKEDENIPSKIDARRDS